MKLSSLVRGFNTVAKSSSKPKVGFVGLGNMGGPMVRHLLKKEFEVNVYDLDKERIKQAVQNGATGCSDLQTVAKNSDAIITMLPNTKICTDVYVNNVFKHARPSTLMLDSSTTGPSHSIYLHEEAKKRQLDFLDAPVTGAVPAATAGALVFLVGAPNEQLFERASIVLSPMAKRVYNCKAVGAGQTAKICNNGALALTMVAICNAFALGKKLGMQPEMLHDIMSMSSARCWTLDTYNPVPGIIEGAPSSRNYERGFAANLMIKDIGLVLEAAEQTGTNVGLVKEMKELYEVLVQKGYGEKDFSYIYEYINGELGNGQNKN